MTAPGITSKVPPRDRSRSKSRCSQGTAELWQPTRCVSRPDPSPSRPGEAQRLRVIGRWLPSNAATLGRVWFPGEQSCKASWTQGQFLMQKGEGSGPPFTATLFKGFLGG